MPGSSHWDPVVAAGPAQLREAHPPPTFSGKPSLSHSPTLPPRFLLAGLSLIFLPINTSSTHRARHWERCRIIVPDRSSSPLSLHCGRLAAQSWSMVMVPDS